MINVYASLISVVIGFVTGYNIRDTVELGILQQELIDTAQARDDAIKLVNDLQSRDPEVIYREIPKVVKRSDCRHLGIDFVRLFNEIHLPGDTGSLFDSVSGAEDVKGR